VPLKRSNFAYVLGSSGVVKRVITPWKMFVKMIKHVHKLAKHLGVSIFAKGLMKGVDGVTQKASDTNYCSTSR
jgi:hypothetical protein